MRSDHTTLNTLFEQLFGKMVADSLIRFPSNNQISVWEQVLEEWIEESSLPLFVRKASALRGSATVHEAGRTLIITDNTPAQWIYRQIGLNDEKLTLTDVKRAIENRTFPLAMIIKQSEREHLIRSQVSNGSFIVDGTVWKLAHIQPIALQKSKLIGIEEYKKHHRRFLSLDNMYIIRKDFSGIAEVELFNIMVAKYKQAG